MSPGKVTLLVDNTNKYFLYTKFVWEQGLKFLVERNAFVIDQQNVYHDVIACKPADVVAFIRGGSLIRKVMEGVGKFLSCMNVFVNMSIISLVIFPLH